MKIIFPASLLLVLLLTTSCDYQKLISENENLITKQDSLLALIDNLNKELNENRAKTDAIAFVAFKQAKKCKELSTCNNAELHSKLRNELEAAQKAAERSRTEAMKSQELARKAQEMAEKAAAEAMAAMREAEKQAAIAVQNEMKALEALKDAEAARKALEESKN